MSSLALFLLGPPRIERDGVLIDVDTRKAIALLAYLAITRQQHSRDTLATLLWPDYDQPHARATLRRTLSALNKALAGNWLEIGREMVGLNQNSDFWLDVEHFSNLLAQCQTHGHSSSEICSACLQPLTEAVALYRDDFLAGFSLRDSPNFDSWQFYQADSLHRDLANALERLVQCYSSQGDYEAAIRYARRWLALDRLHEPAYRHLMQLYAWAGDRTAALHQYRECVQVLDQELGVAPLAETTRLYQTIKENQLSPPPMPIQPPPSVSRKETTSDTVSLSGPSPVLSPASVAQPPVSNAHVPLMGRSAEWAKLSEAYTSSSTHSSIIMLSGEAGIGKTRLAEELVAYARSKGAAVVAARGYEGETQLAYEPIVEGLRTMLAHKHDVHWLEDIPEPWLSEASRLVPELTLLHPGLPSPPQLDSPGAQTRFFEGLQQVLLAACGSGKSQYPGVIFIDDIHWADEASLALLSYMVRRLRDHPICLLLTCRSKQVHSDARLKQLLVEAQRFSKATVLSLLRLNRSTVEELVQSVLATSPTPRHGLVERLYQETEGVPFFLMEYLTAIANGVLKAEDADWSLPGGTRDLLHSRLAAVSEIGWQLLTTAAVIGRSFDFDTLCQASGRSEEEIVTALEELMAQGIVEEVHEGTGERGLNYDFSHEKLRTLVYEETSLARSRLLHRRIAEMLVGRMRGHRDTGLLAGQIAHHYRMAGNEVAAAQYYVLAGEHARSLYANREALAHFHLALALGPPDTAFLHEAIGDVYTLLGEYSAALKSYETAAALCDPHALATVEHKLGKVYERRGEWEAAEAHFESALHALEEAGPTGERAKIYADWSLAAHHRGQTNRAQDLAREALQLAQEAQDTRALAQVHNILGILASRQNNLEEALHHLESSLALAESLNDSSFRVAALNNLALTYGAVGKFDQAITFAESALALCISQGDRHREAALHSNLADLLHNVGRAEEAISHLKQSASIYAEIGVEAGMYQPEIWKLVEW